MVEALEAASTDDSLRAVVIRSTGEHFCSGADWVGSNSSDGAKPRPGSLQRRTPLQAHRLITLIQEVQLPVVAAVQGWAAGLGCQRSEERRRGKEWVSTCRSWWSPVLSNKKKKQNKTTQ